MKVEINDFDLDMETISTEIIIGPQKSIMKKVDMLNTRYLDTNYLSGNRSVLERLPKIGITRTYRWKPKYKDTIVDCLETRFDQYHKQGSNLTTMLLGRPDRMRWSKQNFVSEVIAIDNELKSLRSRKITMDDTTATAVESYRKLLEHFNRQVEISQEMLQAFPDFDLNCYIRYAESRDPNAINQELGKWNSAHLVIELRMKNTSIQVLGLDTSERACILGKIPTGTIYTAFQVPVRGMIDAMFSKDISELKRKDIEKTTSRYNRMSQSERDYLDINSYSHYSAAAKWIAPYLNDYDSTTHRDRSYAHPFMTGDERISNGFKREDASYWKEWVAEDFEEYDYSESELNRLTMNGNHVCFGNVGDDLADKACSLDIMGLINTLQSWLTYKIGTTGPLNNIAKSVLYVSPEYHSNFIKGIGMGVNNMYSRLMKLHGMEGTLADNGNYSTQSEGIYRVEGYNASHWYKIRDVDDHSFNSNTYKDYYYGWDFTRPNWLPTSSAVQSVMEHNADYHDYFELPYEEEHFSEDDKKFQDLIIQDLQEQILVEVMAVIDWLEQYECQTRDTDNYKELIEFVEKVTNSIATKEVYRAKESAPQVVDFNAVLTAEREWPVQREAEDPLDETIEQPGMIEQMMRQLSERRAR